MKIVDMIYKDENENVNTYYLLADFKSREVTTNCGDFYYDYSINFDDFIKFAKHIEKRDKELNKDLKKVIRVMLK